MGIGSNLSQSVRTILQQQFPPPDKITVRDEDGIIAIVVSPQFEGLDDLARQELVWQEIGGQLSRPEQREIAIIVAVTPEEENAYSV